MTDAQIARSRATTRPILSSDRGKRSEDLDLAVAFDETERCYFFFTGKRVE
jgi:hypothetical protein